MKYTIIINQVGIYKENLVKKTDLVDWAIIDYIKDFRDFKDRKKIMVDNEEYVWINYSHLIQNMPLLKINEKDALTNRFKKLKKLGLIKTFLSKDNSLYVRLTERCASIQFYRRKDDLSDFDRTDCPISIGQGLSDFDRTAQVVYSTSRKKELEYCETEVSHKEKDFSSERKEIKEKSEGEEEVKEGNSLCASACTDDKTDNKNDIKEKLELDIISRQNKIAMRLKEKYSKKQSNNINDKGRYSNEVYKIAEVFSKEWYNKFKEINMPKWGGKEWKQAKILIDKVGFDDAVLIIKYVFKNWDELAEVWKVRGDPNIGIILGYGIGILREAKVGRSIGYVPKKKGRIQYDEEASKNSKVAGWSRRQ